MKTPPRKNLLTRIVHTALFAGLCCAIPQAFAAGWNLSNVPLNLSNTVPANVLLLVDDSGSMDWEIMSNDLAHNGLFTGIQPDGTFPSGSNDIKNRDSDGNGKADCKLGSGQTFYGYLYGVEFDANRYGDNDNDCNTADDREWRFRNHDYNKFYFDPTKPDGYYAPWPGTNADGSAFTNMDVHAARANPWKGWRGKNETIDLTKHNSNAISTGRETSKDWDGDGQPDGFRYYTWVDTNKNGNFDNSTADTVTDHQIRKESTTTQQNFANWFSYYRSRHLIAKAAFGRVIANINGLRVGLATLHSDATTSYNVNTPLSLIDSTTTGEANRKNLMNNLYQFDPNNGTPLQSTLKQAGEYLSGHSTNTLFPGNTAAPLSLTQGGLCQQNFTLLMTDGFYNGTYNDSSPTVGNADTDGTGPWDGGLYQDGVTKTLGDIAMYYYENDIIPATPAAADKVPTTTSLDEATHQHMVTFTVAFGVSGNLKGMPNDYAAGTWPGWPTSSDSTADKFTDPQRIDDLRHAAYNGRGEFMEANDPDGLIDAVNDMLGSIKGRTNSSSATSINMSALRKNTVTFRAGYDGADWHGKLLYNRVNTSGVILTPEIADAGTMLTSAVSASPPGDRHILTINSSAPAGTPAGIKFRHASLPATQAALITPDALNYVRGNRTGETSCVGSACVAKNQRSRVSVLGDIVNSTPVYVSVPEENYYINDPSYLEFIKARAARTPVIYVGANDGMLHGFNAKVNADGTAIPGETGSEVIAYVPGAVYKNLASLADPAYSHRYFVDATPVVGDAQFGTEWRSILISGLRGGGQAMFALDVTDPAAFKEDNAATLVKWEFSDVNDADLGYTYGEPAIAKMADGSWAAIFGNGYNNTLADGHASTTGNAALFVVNLDTGALIRKISTGVGTAQDPDGLGRPNGLSGVRVVDVDGDSVADFVYAGDLFGNLWRFDMNSTAPTPSFGAPLFTTSSIEGKMQSITVRPTIGPHVQGLNKGYMVYFGTGKFLEAADNSKTGQPTQTFYGLWDQWPKGSTTPPFSAITRTTLQPQTIVAEDAAKGYRVTSSTSVNWDLKKGWYMDLKVTGATSNNGERVINEALIVDGQAIFSTFQPNTNVCEVGGGGYVMILDAATGAAPLLPPLDISGDLQFNESDLITIGGVVYVVSGYKSFNGAPSAPVYVEGDGGTQSYVFIACSDGTACDLTPDSTPTPTPGPTTDKPLGGGNSVNLSTVEGRITWRRLR